MKKWLGFLFIVMLALSGCSKTPTAEDRFSQYISLWEQQNFSKMYNYLSSNAKQSVSKQQFVTRYQKIYNDLEISNIKVNYKKPKDNKAADIIYSAKMNSIAGPIQFSNKAHLTNENNNWFVNWDTTSIFPQLKKGDKIGISTTDPARGDILDRNGQPLATNGPVYEVGVVPGKMGAQKDYVISQLSSLLQMTPDQINRAITQSWVTPDSFVPLKKISMNDKTRIAQLIALAPVQTKKSQARIYPSKDAAAQLIGYVGSITAEELAKLKNKGYTSTDIIGKRGLEQVFDEQLKGVPGAKITINKPDGTKELLAEKQVENGKTITLTIDAGTQQKIFAGMNGEAGAAAAMNPQTGETLALVSRPSFDPNQAVLGYSTEQWQALQNNPKQPLLTRFKQGYAPGSTMKPITASIGLTAGKLDPYQGIPITGLKWQKDKSWGDYYVTRVHASSPVNLEKALVLSDNIYFAQTALKIGKTAFTDGLKKFGFGENMDYPYPLTASSYGNLESDISIADSGYGQGQIQMNIVHLMAAYTPFINGGNMMKPILLASDKKSQIWKQQVISGGNAALMSGFLNKVVADPSGTAHGAVIPGYPLAGKTGTAEIKEKQGTTGTENGWFIAYNPESPNLLIAMVVEKVQGRGGSQIPVKLVKNIFTQLK